ncbi:MAG: hypothetical protein JWM86_255, partial [Thermoleophilia bacterium]|nr:hypothetical protein [Thermoleophilia bacterium]
STARRERAAAFAAGARTLAAIDPARVAPPEVPAWEPLQRDSDAVR